MLVSQVCRPFANINQGYSFQRQLLRSITYLHSGPRVRGIKRNPESYMTNPYGLAYDQVSNQRGQSTSEFFSKIRNSLPLQQFGISLDDNLLLQCFTHKSFAHGKLPYNEKLSIMGLHFLKVQSSVHSMEIKPNISAEKLNDIMIINGKDFSKLGSFRSKKLLSDGRMYNFMKCLGLKELAFWKKRDPTASNIFNGEPKVISGILNSIIGAILLTNGSEKTALFVQDFLFNPNSEYSGGVSLEKPPSKE